MTKAQNELAQPTWEADLEREIQRAIVRDNIDRMHNHTPAKREWKPALAWVAGTIGFISTCFVLLCILLVATGTDPNPNSVSTPTTTTTTVVVTTTVTAPPPPPVVAPAPPTTQAPVVVNPNVNAPNINWPNKPKVCGRYNPFC